MLGWKFIGIVTVTLVPAMERDAEPVLIEHRLLAIDPGVPGTTPLADTNCVPVSLIRFNVLLEGK